MRINWRALLAIAVLVLICVPVHAAPVYLTYESQPYTPTEDLIVSYCANLQAPVCAINPKRMPKGVKFDCDNATFGPDPAVGQQKRCFGEPAPVAIPPVLTPITVCLPDLKADLWNIAYRTGPAPFTDTPNFVVWQGKQSCGGKVQGQLYSNAELAEFTFRSLFTDTAVNAWVRTQPVTALSPEQRTFLLEKKTAYAESLLPLPASVVTWWVQPIALGTRPYYKANAALTAISGAKLGDVPVKTACDKAKRLGTTSYYFVPSVNGWSVCSAP